MQIFRACGLGVILAVASGQAVAQVPSAEIERYGVFAEEGIRARGITVLAGDVGVHDGSLTSTRALDAPSSLVVAGDVALDPASSCAALFTTSGNGTARCGPPHSFNEPL